MSRPDPVYIDAQPNTFQRGLEYQDFVCELLARHHIVLQNIASKRFQFEVGENLHGWEIKLDRPCTETGRLSIEIAEKSRAAMPNWTPSGIYREDNSWLYIQGNYELVFLFAVNWLRRYYEQRVAEADVHEAFGTVRKFYLPLDAACVGAIKFFDLREEPSS